MIKFIVKRDLTDANNCRILLFDPPKSTEGDMEEGNGLNFNQKNGTEAIFTAEEGAHIIGIADAFCEPGAQIKIQVKPADEITLFRDIFVYIAPEILKTEHTDLGYPVTKLFAFRLPKIQEWQETLKQPQSVH